MPEVYEQNIEALYAHNQLTAEGLKKQQGENSLYSVRYQNSVLSIQDQLGHLATYDKTINFQIEQAPSLMLIFGFGDGQLIYQALENPKIDDVLVYEPQAAVLNQMFQCKDYSDILSSDRLTLITGCHPQELKTSLSGFFVRDRSRLTKLSGMLSFTTPFCEVFPENVKAFDQFDQVFKQAINSCQTEHTPFVEDAYRGLLNTLRNYPEYFQYPQFDCLKNIHKGKPGIVVCTGPSLGKSLDRLRDIQNKAVICAVDSALGILQKNDIQADYVTSLERDGAIPYLFEGMEEAPQTHLIAPAVLVPDAFTAYKGPKIQMCRDVGFENWVSTAESKVRIGSSASHVALVALRHMGCEPIFLLGQDCCYDPFSGESHDSQVAEHVLKFGEQEKNEFDEVEKFDVPGLDGKPRRTMKWWWDFNQMISELIAVMGYPKVYNIMPKQYGTNIHLTDHIEPEKAFAEYFGTDIDIASDKKRIVESDHDIDFGFSKLQEVKANLEKLRFFSLEVMQEIGIFWNDNDIRIEGRGLLQKYEAFFKKLESYQNELYQIGNGFFEEYFLKLILSNHAFIGDKLMQISQAEKSVIKSVNGRIHWIYEWYSTVHHWASRSLMVIETQNRRWKRW